MTPPIALAIGRFPIAAPGCPTCGETVMTRMQRIALVGVAWLVGASALFVWLGTPSLVGWAILGVSALVPPVVYAALSGGPPITIAEVLRDAEDEKERRV